MENISLIYILAAIVLTVVITFFLTKRKYAKEIIPEEEKGNIEEKGESEEKEELFTKAECDEQLHNLENSYLEKIKEVQEQSEKIKQEASQKTADLEEELKKAIDGNIDDIVKGKLAEIDKLKKEISSLEDELDEAEDDQKDLKKKLNNERNEHSALQIKFDESQRVIKETRTVLEETKNELEKKEDELSLKGESLEFIQEILSAPLSSSQDVKELYENVDRVVDFVTGELRDSVNLSNNALSEEEKELLTVSPKLWAILEKKSWIKNKTTIAFVGEFSAGKTSIVNRILSQDDPEVPRLPVSTKATTAIPTYISGGINTRYEFVTPSNELKSISEKTFKKVSKEVLDQVKGVSSLIQYFVMTYQNKNLEHLSILDTPGFNSNDAEDAERTIDVINECDALFWVVDVNAGTVNRSSTKLIKEYLTKPLYVVINKVDTKAKSEVDKVEELIKHTFEEDGISVQGFIRFSAKEELETIMKPIMSINHDDSNDQFVYILKKYIDDSVKSLDKYVTKLNKRYNALNNESNRLIDRYNEAISGLANDCETASQIPHFEDHWFKEDNYEMSQLEFQNLIDVLNKICCDDSNALVDLYNDQMSKCAEVQQAYSDYIDEKAIYRSLSEKNDILIKLLKNF